MALFPKPGKVEDPDYIEWIKGLQCWITGAEAPDPHHVNDKSGGSAKFNDRRAIPLSHHLHVELHQVGQHTFALKYKLDYEGIIEALNKVYEETACLRK